MINFASISHLQGFTEYLDSLTELHNDAFDALYGHLDEDETDEFMASLNFHEDQPSLDFENFCQFLSLRKKLETEEDIWLQNYTLDFDNYPDDLGILSETERAIANENGMVSIAGVPDDVLKRSWICDITRNDCCTIGTQKERYYYTYGGSERYMLLKIKLREWGVSSYLKGRTVAYKRRNNGNGWQRVRTNMYVSVRGRHRDRDCNLQGNPWFKDKGPKKRKKLYATQWNLGSLMRAQDFDMNVRGRFEDHGNQENALFLTF